jgi:hypothetical protein
MHGVSDRAGLLVPLAMAVHPVLPSACTYGVGIPKYLPLARQGMHFAAQYPACTSLCQRFAFVLADAGT